MAIYKGIDLKKAQNCEWSHESEIKTFAMFAFSEFSFITKEDFDRFIFNLANYFKSFFECKIASYWFDKKRIDDKHFKQFYELFEEKNKNFANKLAEVYNEDDSISIFSDDFRILISLIVVPVPAI